MHTPSPPFILSVCLTLLSLATLSPHPVQADAVFEAVSHFLQPNLQECASRRLFPSWFGGGKDRRLPPCPASTECVQRRCLPTDTEKRTMIRSGDDMQRALFAASLSATQFELEPPPELNRTNAHTCSHYTLRQSIDFQPEGYRFSLYEGPKFDILVFKGTTSKREWLEDFNFFKTPCTLTTVHPTTDGGDAGGDGGDGEGDAGGADDGGPFRPPTARNQTGTSSPCGMVHLGFQTIFDRMRPALDRMLSARFERHPKRTLVVTGHSLGGALATLASLHVSSMPGWQDKVRAVFLMGSPRVGDQQFVQAYRHWVSSRSMVRRFFMVDGGLSRRDRGDGGDGDDGEGSSKLDPVTMLPAESLDYKHVVPGVGIECRNAGAAADAIATIATAGHRRQQTETCSARQLHSIDLYVEVLRELVQKKFFAFRKCGEI